MILNKNFFKLTLLMEMVLNGLGVILIVCDRPPFMSLMLDGTIEEIFMGEMASVM